MSKMGSIRVLSESLRNQIAAGEVVERPASVIKELIENAIDAKATQIDIAIFAGGTQSIRVRDNGSGMTEEDALMALKRYATSKIFTADDLFDLHSFGFRGEALASIASISKLLLTTKQKEGDSAIQITAHNAEVSNIGAPDGTEVIVQDLFYNVPARKKFLKTEKTESAHVTNIVQDLALAHPSIGFRLTLDDRMVLDTPVRKGDTALLQRIQDIFGNTGVENVSPIQFLGKDLSISGYASHPHIHRRNRKNQKIFVNKRPVSDRMIFAAISQAYESLVPKGFYPDVFLFLDIAPDLVDVNVHPRKSEVKFLQEREVFRAVKGAIQSAFKEETDVTQRNEEQKWTLRSSEKSFLKTSLQQIPPQEKFSFSKSIPNSLGSAPSAPASVQPSSFSKGKNDVIEDGRVIGQIRNSFLLVEQEEGLMIIDQHAAHERVRYEILMKNLKEKTPQSQRLLLPQIIEVSPAEKQVLEEYREILKSFGFEIEEFSNHEMSLFAVPSGTEKTDFTENLKNLLHDLEGYDSSDPKAVLSPAERIATFAACRGAVKFGDKLTLPEMEQLLVDLRACETSQACAHGRPVWMYISYDQMEREHGR